MWSTPRGLSGLSPRGRGNRGSGEWRRRRARSIPAWAGKPPRAGLGTGPVAVYPRVGGETLLAISVSITTNGLSPRGRGNPGELVIEVGQLGSIPAWAGKPATEPAAKPLSRVYPRVGGETPRSRSSRAKCAGLSPRGRGNPVQGDYAGAGLGSIPAWAGKPSPASSAAAGSRVYPPRGRGNPPRRSPLRARRRSIPAWAGKPVIPSSGARHSAVYPRVGGETLSRSAMPAIFSGLSPRGRGNLHRRQPAAPRLGSIPAWAGKPGTSRPPPAPAWVYPRVGGETAGARGGRAAEEGLSPRGRGNRAAAHRGAMAQWSIPAWAGKPLSRRRRYPPLMVYPRVGGETEVREQIIDQPEGLSPRGRGNHRDWLIAVGMIRSIPAWAGKPRSPSRPPRSTRVYPRVGGETSAARLSAVVIKGLSPRGRGNHHAQDQDIHS